MGKNPTQAEMLEMRMTFTRQQDEIERLKRQLATAEQVNANAIEAAKERDVLTVRCSQLKTALADAHAMRNATAATLSQELAEVRARENSVALRRNALLTEREAEREAAIECASERDSLREQLKAAGYLVRDLQAMLNMQRNNESKHNHYGYIPGLGYVRICPACHAVIGADAACPKCPGTGTPWPYKPSKES